MRILALDLGSVTGLCIGEAGRVWPARSTTVKFPHETPGEGAARLGSFLRDKFEQTWGSVDAIAIEQWLDPSRQRTSREVIVTQQLHGAVCGIAGCYGLQPYYYAPATVRAKVCGQPHGLAGEDTKDMVVRCAIEFGYLPEGSTDHNAGDAGLIFHYASWILAQRWNHLPGRVHQGLPLLEGQ